MTSRGVSLNIPKMPSRGYVILDTETTGLHDPSRVIELALVFMSLSGEIEDTWTTLLKGDGHAGGSRLERVHGIKSADLKRAPSFGQIVTKLEKALYGRLVFGHNSKFDRARLNYELALESRTLLPELPCTMNLGKYLGYGQLKLDDAIDYFGITRKNAHCAFDDALATAELLQVFMETHPAEFESYLTKKKFQRL